MEKFSQFRDRGTGITPFIPVTSKTTGVSLAFHTLLFVMRLPIFLIAAVYFLLLQWLPLGPLFRKAVLWIILGIPGVWWIDLQIDGVKRGSLAKHHVGRVPGPSDVIASSYTSPIDALYLAAVFDPIFTISYPHTSQVQVVSLFGAILRALSKPEEHHPVNAKLTEISILVAKNKQRVIVVFPECTTSNGKGILPLSPSLLTSPAGTKIFPVHLRYTPPDITTPVPGLHLSFIWNLLSRPTHSIRVRIAEVVISTLDLSHDTSKLDDLYKDTSMTNGTQLLNSSSGRNPQVMPEGRDVLDKVGEALARLGRVKRVRLTVKDKMAFVNAWAKK